MTTPARELRDALAELLRARAFPLGAEQMPWSDTMYPEPLREKWRAKADEFLASLPSVKLKIGWEE